MGELIQADGPVMWPLLVLALVSLGIFSERMIFWIRLNSFKSRSQAALFLEFAEKGDFDEAGKIVQGAQDPVLRTLKRGLEHRNGASRQAMEQQGAEEFRAMKRYLALLDTITAAAPLLGILGTVTHIMRTFQTAGASGVPDSRALLIGIAQALIPTMFGLVVAIFTLLISRLLARKAHREHEEMRTHASALEIFLVRNEETTTPPIGQQAQPLDTAAVPAGNPAQSPITRRAPLEALGGLSEKEKRFFLS